MTSPTVSVAMSVYNNSHYVSDAIESILSQSFRDFELLIVNDGSTDESPRIIDRFAAIDPRIRAIHQPNQGLIFSLNRAIELARGAFIARMDGDDIAEPDRFSRQLAFLHAHPDIGVLGTGCRYIDNTGKLTGDRPVRSNNPDEFGKLLEEGPPLFHPTVMMRTELVRSVKGYRSAYRHCEDYDLWLRLASVTRMSNLPERLLRYRHSETQVSYMHIVEQHVNAAIAWQSELERRDGRSDPTDGLERLPHINELDTVFCRDGVTACVRARVARSLVYSPIALRGAGFQIILDHIAGGGERTGLWRTVGRLITMGEPSRAARLFTALVTGR